MGVLVGVALLPLYRMFRFRGEGLVSILGYVGCGNAGDEWIVANLVETVRPALRPGERIVVFSATPAETGRRLDVEGAARTSPWDVVNALWNSTVFLGGPGGLFQDRTGWLTTPYYLGFHVLAALLRVPRVAMVGQSFGSLSSPVLRRAVALQASRADLVLTRDRASVARLAAWGAAPANVHAGVDLAFWARPAIPGVVRRARLAVSLRPDPAWTPARVDAFAEAVRDFAGREGLKPVGLAMDPARDEPFLRARAFSLLDEVVPLAWPGLLEAFAGCRVGLVMRYHAAAACILTDTPFVALVYDSKVADLVAETGWPWALSWDDLDAGKAGDVFRRFSQERSRAQERLKAVRAALFEGASASRERFLHDFEGRPETNGRPRT